MVLLWQLNIDKPHGPQGVHPSPSAPESASPGKLLDMEIHGPTQAYWIRNSWGGTGNLCFIEPSVWFWLLSQTGELWSYDYKSASIWTIWLAYEKKERLRMPWLYSQNTGSWVWSCFLLLCLSFTLSSFKKCFSTSSGFSNFTSFSCFPSGLFCKLWINVYRLNLISVLADINWVLLVCLHYPRHWIYKCKI